MNEKKEKDSLTVSLESDNKSPEEPTKVDKLNELSKKVTNDKEEKKQKGRPKKTVQDKNVQDFQKIVSGLGSTLLNMVVVRMPNPEPLSKDEKNQIDLAFDNLMKKYVPYLGNYSEEIAFVSVAGIALLTRSNLLKMLTTQEEIKHESKQ